MMNSKQEQQLVDALIGIDKSLKSLVQIFMPVEPAWSVEFYLIKDGQKEKVVKMFMKVDEQLELAVAFKDKKGNVAKVDGIPAWALSDVSLGKLEVNADGMGAKFVPVGVGKLVIQVKADADLGEGTRDIIGELEVEVSALEAERVELSAVVKPQDEPVVVESAPEEPAPVEPEPAA